MGAWRVLVLTTPVASAGYFDEMRSQSFYPCPFASSTSKEPVIAVGVARANQQRYDHIDWSRTNEANLPRGQHIPEHKYIYALTEQAPEQNTRPFPSSDSLPFRAGYGTNRTRLASGLGHWH
jgi:hypothetical protein